MNQIIFNKWQLKLKLFFIIQFCISVILEIFFISYIMENKLDNIYVENNSQKLNKLINISKIYNKEMEEYFCKIKIEKLNIDYLVFNNYSDDLLKILPCKFYGGNLEEPGNICIVGHNYENNMFFSNLNKLKENDEIILESLDNKQYKYYVYEIKEVDFNDISILRKTKMNQLTLLTCNNSNKQKRFVVKAYLKNKNF